MKCAKADMVHISARRFRVARWDIFDFVYVVVEFVQGWCYGESGKSWIKGWYLFGTSYEPNFQDCP